MSTIKQRPTFIKVETESHEDEIGGVSVTETFITLEEVTNFSLAKSRVGRRLEIHLTGSQKVLTRDEEGIKRFLDKAGLDEEGNPKISKDIAW